mgnify:FL=1
MVSKGINGIFACIEHSPIPVWIKKAGCYFYYLCNLYGSSVFFWSMADYGCVAGG